jgi:hypothetical protein
MPEPYTHYALSYCHSVLAHITRVSLASPLYALVSPKLHYLCAVKPLLRKKTQSTKIHNGESDGLRWPLSDQWAGSNYSTDMLDTGRIHVLRQQRRME